MTATRRTIQGTSKGERIDGSRGDDIIHAAGGNDRIAGHAGNDQIYGDASNDRIHGGKGNDILRGGQNSDTFIFGEFGVAHRDKIVDFAHGVDHIELKHMVFNAFDAAKVGADEFYLGSKAHDSNDHLIYNKSTGQLFYDDDGTGSHKQQLVAILTNHAALSASDFILG